MDSLTYFAYGSNMLAARLARRCASARFTAVGSIPDFTVAFSKRSKDGSGKATLIEAPGAEAYGALFSVGRDDLVALDRIEGVGQGYHRLEDIQAYAFPDQTPVRVTTYVADAEAIDHALRPYDWYLALVVKGAERKGLPAPYRKMLVATPAIPDPLPSRRSRLEALAILQASGGGP